MMIPTKISPSNKAVAPEMTAMKKIMIPTQISPSNKKAVAPESMSKTKKKDPRTARKRVAKSTKMMTSPTPSHPPPRKTMAATTRVE
jgi:hypothetical protein